MVACKQRGYQFTAFVVESYGGLGVSARMLLRKLAAESVDLDARAFEEDALVRVSVALQRGNALVMRAGMERHALATALGAPDRPLGGPAVMQSNRRKGWMQARVAAQEIDQSVVLHAAAAAAHASA